MKYPNTTMVCLDKSKLTKWEVMFVKMGNTKDGIQIQETATHIFIYDLEYNQPKFMFSMVSLQYRIAKR